MGQKKELALLCAVATASLAIFINKAFCADDPLFLWGAAQIREHPLDAYGLSINWYGTWQPLWQATHNPPVASYLLALVASLFGASEVVLHAAFVLPAVGVVVGAWYLCRLAGIRSRLVAAFVTLASPGFLASSTNVMCDTLMVCFSVWSVALWIDGLRLSKPSRLAAASILVAAAALTKYFALSLWPLLVACTIVVDRRRWRAVLWLLVPSAIFATYECWTWALYGTVHVLHASFIAVGVERGGSLLNKTIVALSFTGASFLPIVFFLPFIASKRFLALTAFFALAIAVYFKEVAWQPGLAEIGYHHQMTWAAAAQLALFITGGALVIALALVEGRHLRSDPISTVLALWILGTYVFAGYVNWGCNVRSVLPMAPAIGILVARRIGRCGTARFAALALVPAGLVALAVAYADFNWANSARELANSVAETSAGKRLWFEGHWGFQCYLQKRGGREVDFLDPQWEVGDLIAVPEDNADTRAVPEEYARLVTTVTVPSPWPPISIMSRPTGAGFYSAFFGPMPFVFEAPPPQRCLVLMATKPGANLVKDALR